eukprot:354988-Chlamydomonas_euryale.AAC.1
MAVPWSLKRRSGAYSGCACGSDAALLLREPALPPHSRRSSESGWALRPDPGLRPEPRPSRAAGCLAGEHSTVGGKIDAALGVRDAGLLRVPDFLAGSDRAPDSGRPLPVSFGRVTLPCGTPESGRLPVPATMSLRSLDSAAPGSLAKSDRADGAAALPDSRDRPDSGLVPESGLLPDSGLAAETDLAPDSGLAPEYGLKADSGLAPGSGRAPKVGQAMSWSAASVQPATAGLSLNSGGVPAADAPPETSLPVPAATPVRVAGRLPSLPRLLWLRDCGRSKCADAMPVGTRSALVSLPALGTRRDVAGGAGAKSPESGRAARPEPFTAGLGGHSLGTRRLGTCTAGDAICTRRAAWCASTGSRSSSSSSLSSGSVSRRGARRGSGGTSLTCGSSSSSGSYSSETSSSRAPRGWARVPGRAAPAPFSRFLIAGSVERGGGRWSCAPASSLSL